MVDTISFSLFLYMCEYVFNVSSILVCPRYFATIVIFAPLLISREAQLCLKSCILICLSPAFLHNEFLWHLTVELVIGSVLPKTNHLLLNPYNWLSLSNSILRSFKSISGIGIFLILDLVFGVVIE